MNRLVRVMFLGGSLDHAVREVPADSHDPALPASDTYRVNRPVQLPLFSDESLVEPDIAREVYKRWRVKADPLTWYFYALAGHQPTRAEMIDANLRIRRAA